jgi:hypothetical protein
MCNDDDDKTTFLIPHPVPDIQQQHYEYLLFVEVSPCFVLNLNLNAGPRGRSGGLGTGTVRIGSMAVRLWAIVVHQTNSLVGSVVGSLSVSRLCRTLSTFLVTDNSFAKKKPSCCCHYYHEHHEHHEHHE